MFTGKDLIIYILEHGLVDEPVCNEYGGFLDMLTVDEVAAKFGVGIATIQVLVDRGTVDYLRVGKGLYFPTSVRNPMNNAK